MLQAQTRHIQDVFVVQYSNLLVRVRKSQKGLRIQYFDFIMLVGRNEGATCAELTAIAGGVKSTVFTRLLRATKTGFIRKESKRYYLTDSGRNVYTSVCREFDASMNEILKVLIEEARRRA